MKHLEPTIRVHCTFKKADSHEWGEWPGAQTSLSVFSDLRASVRAEAQSIL